MALTRLSHVNIANFRSIRKLELDIPPFAVLVGPNGSGKTNFVQALTLLGEVLQHGSTEPVEALGWDAVVRRAKKRAHHMVLGARVVVPERKYPMRRDRPEVRPEITVDVEIDLKPAGRGAVRVEGERLRLASEESTLEVTVRDDEVEVRSDGPPRLAEWILPRSLFWHSRATHGERHEEVGLDDLSADDLKSLLTEYLSPGQPTDEPERRYLRLLAFHRWFGGLLGTVVDACQVDRLRLDATALRSDSPARGDMGGAGEGLAAAVADLRGMGDKPNRAFEPVLQALQEVFPRIEDVVPIRTQPGRLALSFKERGVKEAFSQASVSDGLLHALALLVGLAPPGRRAPPRSRRRGLLAIEEPENAIHPWSIRVLMERIQDQGARHRQVLLTTHSVEVVNQVRDPGALLICEVGDRGTTIVPATTKESALAAIMRETGERLGDMWQSGSLGGIP